MASTDSGVHPFGVRQYSLEPVFIGAFLEYHYQLDQENGAPPTISPEDILQHLAVVLQFHCAHFLDGTLVLTTNAIVRLVRKVWANSTANIYPGDGPRAPQARGRSRLFVGLHLKTQNGMLQTSVSVSVISTDAARTRLGVGCSSSTCLFLTGCEGQPGCLPEGTLRHGQCQFQPLFGAQLPRYSLGAESAFPLYACSDPMGHGSVWGMAAGDPSCPTCTH